jgi:PKD repeat protein
VQVDIGSLPVCALTADASGNLSGTQSNGCRVPSGLSPGSQPLTASDPTDGTATGSAFTVTPVASFTAPASLTYGTTLSLDASQSQGTITHYFWDFGDGTTGSTTTPTTTHSYSIVGNYVVTLTVVDSSGNIDSAAHTVDVIGSPPTAAFAPPAAARAGTTLAFDGSQSSTPNAGATITRYDWKWGDGTPDGTGVKPTHSYSAAGTYAATLTVTDSAGETSQPVSQTVEVEGRPPVAAFTPTSAIVLAGSNVLFDGTQSSDPDGTITGYSWKFGDGGSSTSAQPTHRYLDTGTFTVTLTVVDNLGNQGTVSHQITVIAPPPIQTLILTPVAAPALVRYGPVSTTKSGLVNLGRRGFCPGPGPSCTVTIIATSSALARAADRARPVQALVTRAPARVGRSVIKIGPNGSAELTFKLSKAALASLRKRGRLPLTIKIALARHGQAATRTLRLTLVSPSR